MWSHAKGASLACVFLAIWGVIGGFPVFLLFDTFDRNLLWFLWGFVFSLADLAILLSRPARTWVKEPTERKWHHAES
jgi:hypothetical protein